MFDREKMKTDEKIIQLLNKEMVEKENNTKGLLLWMLIAGCFGLLLGYSAGFVHGVQYFAEKGIEALNMLDIQIDNIEINFNETQLIEGMIQALNESEATSE